MGATRSRFLPRLLAAAALAVTLPLAGCLDYEETLTVAPDGSGTLALDLKLDLSFIAEIKKIDPQPESEDSGDVKNLVSKEELEKECAVPGITLKTCEVTEQGPHKSHVKLELTFKDLDSLRAIRSFSDRELVVEEKGEDVSFVYRYNVKSLLFFLNMGAEGDGDEKDKPKELTEKEKKIRDVVESARKAASARFLMKMPGKIKATNGEKAADEKSAKWTIDKTKPKAQDALLKDPISMELTLAKKDAPFWEKERESAKKRAAAEGEAPGKKDPGQTDPGKPPRPGKKPGLGDDE